MNLKDYCSRDAVGLADLIAKGEISAAETAQAAQDAYEKVNGDITAVIEFYEDRTTQDATSTLPQGPFTGVPFLIKDLVCHEAGKLMEGGSRLGEGVRTPHDTHLMARYKQAGLNNLGRTKSPELGFNLTTENVLHGPVHNPWKHGISSGGSSGGSAAAVAAGIVPAAHANDGGGSIRIPASCCGLVGLRPTRGRTPIGPDAADGLNGLGIEHVVSRSVRDSAALLDATQGPGPGDPYEIAPPAAPYLSSCAKDPAPLKIAYAAEGFNGAAPHADVDAVLQATAQQLEALGHTVEAARPDIGMSWDAFVDATTTFWCANLAHWAHGLSQMTGRPMNSDTMEATTLACAAYGDSLSAQDFLAAFDAYNIVTRTARPFFDTYDVWLCPTLPAPPQPHGTSNANAAGLTGRDWTDQVFAMAPYTPVFNATGQPSISLPLGMSSDTLPVGMMFTAQFGREDVLFALAAQLERATPWFDRTPPVFAGS